ncbi:MAG: hypothetical protein WDN50_03725 [Bradyrhizobium sp.]
MLSTSPSEPAVESGVVLDEKPACVALVPVIPSAQWSPSHGQQRSLPSSIFVTHLIATAEHVPQTCGLRRASAADAQTAYRATQKPVYGLGGRTRQII